MTPAVFFLASDDIQIDSKAFYSWETHIMKVIFIQDFSEAESPKPFP